MPRVLVLANLELAFEVPEGTANPEEFSRAKERRLLRFLRRLAQDTPGVTGSMERLEYESFVYASELEAESTGYYYNKHEKRAGTP